MKQRAFALVAACLLMTVATPAAPADIEAVAQSCNGCHGTNGVSTNPSIPSIGGQPETFLTNVMYQWKKGEREPGTMGALMKGYSDEDIGALAAYFAKLPWVSVVQKVPAGLVKRGKEGTVRCAVCHGDTGGTPIGGDTPRLNGQWAKYMEVALAKYRDPAANMPHKKMRAMVMRLGEADATAAAGFYASQK